MQYDIKEINTFNKHSGGLLVEFGCHRKRYLLLPTFIKTMSCKQALLVELTVLLTVSSLSMDSYKWTQTTEPQWCHVQPTELSKKHTRGGVKIRGHPISSYNTSTTVPPVKGIFYLCRVSKDLFLKMVL